MRALKPNCQNLILLCTNERPPGAEKASCGHHGSPALRAWLKTRLKQEGLWGEQVRVVPTGCLDVCPAQGAVLSMDGGRSLTLVDCEADREEIVARIRTQVDETR